MPTLISNRSEVADWHKPEPVFVGLGQEPVLGVWLRTPTVIAADAHLPVVEVDRNFLRHLYLGRVLRALQLRHPERPRAEVNFRQPYCTQSRARCVRERDPAHVRAVARLLRLGIRRPQLVHCRAINPDRRAGPTVPVGFVRSAPVPLDVAELSGDEHLHPDTRKLRCAGDRRERAFDLYDAVAIDGEGGACLRSLRWESCFDCHARRARADTFDGDIRDFPFDGSCAPDPEPLRHLVSAVVVDRGTPVVRRQRPCNERPAAHFVSFERAAFLADHRQEAGPAQCHCVGRLLDCQRRGRVNSWNRAAAVGHRELIPGHNVPTLSPGRVFGERERDFQ